MVHVLRLYSPLEPFFDKTWRPSEIEQFGEARLLDKPNPMLSVFSLHEFDLAWLPFFREERFRRTVYTQERVPTSGRIGLNPVAIADACWLRRAEVHGRRDSRSLVRISSVMRTVASRWIFTLRRECRTSGWRKANWFGWYSTREKHWPKWTKLDHDANCQFLASA
jgi:hypothetical protein